MIRILSRGTPSPHHPVAGSGVRVLVLSDTGLLLSRRPVRPGPRDPEALREGFGSDTPAPCLGVGSRGRGGPVRRRDGRQEGRLGDRRGTGWDRRGRVTPVTPRPLRPPCLQVRLPVFPCSPSSVGPSLPSARNRPTGLVESYKPHRGTVGSLEAPQRESRPE